MRGPEEHSGALSLFSVACRQQAVIPGRYPECRARAEMEVTTFPRQSRAARSSWHGWRARAPRSRHRQWHRRGCSVTRYASAPAALPVTAPLQPSHDVPGCHGRGPIELAVSCMLPKHRAIGNEGLGDASQPCPLHSFRPVLPGCYSTRASGLAEQARASPLAQCDRAGCGLPPGSSPPGETRLLVPLLQ